MLNFAPQLIAVAQTLRDQCRCRTGSPGSGSRRRRRRRRHTARSSRRSGPSPRRPGSACALPRSCADGRSRRWRTPPRCRSRNSWSCRRCRCRSSSGRRRSASPSDRTRGRSPACRRRRSRPPRRARAVGRSGATRSAYFIGPSDVSTIEVTGLPVLRVPRMVPPRRRMPVTSRGVRTRERSDLQQAVEAVFDADRLRCRGWPPP